MRLVAIGAAGLTALVVFMDWKGERDAKQQARDNRAAELRQRDQQEALQVAVSERRVVIGMRAEDVRQAWGEPASVNVSTYASGTQEQWVYRWSNSKQQFVYFADGAVRSIQTLGN